MHPQVQAQVNAAIQTLEAEKKANSVNLDTTSIKYGRDLTVTIEADGDFADFAIKDTRPVEGPKVGKVKQSGGSVYASECPKPGQPS